MTASRFRFLPVIVLVLFLVGCASSGAPAWTFGPTLAPSDGTTDCRPTSGDEGRHDRVEEVPARVPAASTRSQANFAIRRIR